MLTIEHVNDMLRVRCVRHRGSGPHHLPICALCIFGVCMALFDGCCGCCTCGKKNVLAWAGTNAIGAVVNLLAFVAALDIYLCIRAVMSSLGLDDDGGGGGGGDGGGGGGGDGSGNINEDGAKLLLAMVTITLTLVTRTTSCIWGVQMNSGKCGDPPAAEDSG